MSFDPDLDPLLSVLPIALFKFDRDLRFVSYRLGAMPLAVPPEVFLGRRIDEVFGPELAQPFVAAARRVAQDQGKQTVEYDLGVDASGQPVHYRASFVSAPGDTVLVLVQDDSEKHRALRAIESSEQRFRALIEKATDILYVLTQDFTVRMWSAGAESALGWTAEDMLGRQGLDFIHPQDAEQMLTPPKDAPVGEGTRLSYRVRHKNGSYRTLDAQVRNHLGDPLIQGIIVNARDVTEERLQAARSAESHRLESIGRLAGGVAHDFNNLLTVITGAAAYLDSQIRAGEPPDREAVGEILTASNRAAELTRQLLAFARRQVIEPVVLDLNDLLGESERLLHRVLGQHIVLALDRDQRPCRLRADPVQIQQIILNLATNARDAMPGGGRIELSTRRVDVQPSEATLHGLAPGPHVKLVVRDEGAGLPEQVRAHLFEPFFTTKDVGKGSGLGLATVYGIVKQNHGSITVDSVQGHGTTFELLFPASADEPKAPPSQPAPQVHRGTERVLLVEDEPAVAAIAARILRGAGYTVQQASDGHAALDLARRQTFDLLLTDVIMPGMDGPTLAQQLGVLQPQVRMLFVSGYQEETAAHRGIAGRGWKLLPKPYLPDALLLAIRRVLSSRD